MTPRAAKPRQTRARTPLARQQRRLGILDAAERLFVAEPFSAIQMVEVAEASGLAKGTLYLYFQSKESLFLAVTQRRMVEWYGLLRESLNLYAYISPTELAQLFVRTLRVCGTLRRLLALLHPVFEQNVSIEEARAFRTFFSERLAQLGFDMERLLPALGPGAGAQLLMRVHAVIVGVAQSSAPSASLSEVLAEPGLAHLALDFDAELAALLGAVFRGIEEPC